MRLPFCSDHSAYETLAILIDNGFDRNPHRRGASLLPAVHHLGHHGRARQCGR
jgi:hypothetical protein